MTDSSIPMLVALGGAVFLGAATQRISGMGFALVASPLVVALLGPFQGVLLINVLGAVTAFSIFSTLWRRVEYRKVLLLLIPAIIAALPGAIVARLVPGPLLSVVVGSLIVISLIGSFFVVENVRLMGRGGAVLAGGVSGFMSVTAGVGGPAVSAYAIATRWPQTAFAASVQLYFGVLAAVSLLFKGALPVLSGLEWAVCGLALVLGIVVGHLLAKVINARGARLLVIVFAFTGAVLIIVKGAIELWAA